MSNSSHVEVIDRRHHSPDRPEEKVEPVEIEHGEPAFERQNEISADNEKRWDSRGYFISPVMVQAPQGQAQVLSLRGAGTRSKDKQTVVVDYFLPNPWPKNCDPVKEVNKRLDSFLDCKCDMHGYCSVHKLYVKQWVDADVKRLDMAARMPMPDALEVVFKTAQAKEQSRIIIPGR